MKNLLFVVFSLIVFVSTAQEQSALDKKKGFKDIKLFTDVRNYEGLELKKSMSHDKFPEVELYVRKKKYYEAIGDVKIKVLEVIAYHNRIHEIRVVTENDPSLYRGLQTLYGDPVFSVRYDKYIWSGTAMKLAYRANKKGLEFIYTSYEVLNMYKQEQEDEIKDVASDF